MFGLSIGVLMLYCTHSWLHLSLGTPDRWLRWAIVAFVVTGLLFVAGLPFGPFGVAAGYSASFYLLTLPALSYAGKPIDLKASDVVRGVWKYFVAAFSAALTVLRISNAIVIGPTPPGFGVIFPAIGWTFVKSTSPTSRSRRATWCCS